MNNNLYVVLGNFQAFKSLQLITVIKIIYKNTLRSFKLNKMILMILKDPLDIFIQILYGNHFVPIQTSILIYFLVICKLDYLPQNTVRGRQKDWSELIFLGVKKWKYLNLLYRSVFEYRS